MSISGSVTRSQRCKKQTIDNRIHFILHMIFFNKSFLKTFSNIVIFVQLLFMSKFELKFYTFYLITAVSYKIVTRSGPLGTFTSLIITRFNL